MGDRTLIAASIRSIIATSWPERFSLEQLGDDVALGEQGLGLDSVEVVEVVFACEDRCGGPASERLFELSPLTIGQIADHFALARA